MRGEGKTHKMLLEALQAAETQKVYVVVENQCLAVYVRNMFQSITGKLHPKNVELITPDNRYLHVVQGKAVMQGSDAPVFVDHYTWECGRMRHERGTT